ncbi:MAG: hypothetical protein F4X60_00415 [Gemmatimonadetes bacterium]|nr:hypothetical protein [Gemmatimonadota bacterium]
MTDTLAVPAPPADDPTRSSAPPPTPAAHDRILLVDYGSQFTQLIARRIREAGVYCEIHPPDRSTDWVRAWGPTGIVLSGGPSSVYDEAGPGLDPAFLDLGVPILGICYGMQLIARHEGGAVLPGKREYGRATLRVSPSPTNGHDSAPPPVSETKKRGPGTWRDARCSGGG